MPKQNKKNKSKLKTEEMRIKEVNEVKEKLESYGYCEEMDGIDFLYKKLDKYLKHNKRWSGQIPLTMMGQIIVVNLYNRKNRPSVVLLRKDSSV